MQAGAHAADGTVADSRQRFVLFVAAKDGAESVVRGGARLGVGAPRPSSSSYVSPRMSENPGELMGFEILDRRRERP